MTDISHGALTVLSEEEELFRSSVREFAEGEVRPRVEAMEHACETRPGLIKQCFELGLMAIESPEEYGGAGSTIFNAILAIEELARVDASISVFVDVHNTLVTNAFMRWASDEQKEKIPAADGESKVGAYALSRSRSSGSDAFALKTRAVDKGDHYELPGRNSGSRTATKPKSSCSLRPSTRRPATKASRLSSSRKASKDFRSAKKKTSSASALHRRPN